VGKWRRHLGSLLLDDGYSEQFFRVRSLREVRSHECPLCQLADLFAGMGPYSRERDKVMRQLRERESGQLCLVEPGDPASPSRIDEDRFTVISDLYSKCGERRLGLSFSSGCLRTFDPDMPINFWHYEPRSEKDKAPTKHS
jgi:hypothetical protein